MQTAEIFAGLSQARRLQVGAIIVKDDRIISIGYNGMPAGWDNNCEYDVIHNYGADPIPQTRLKTKPEVLHAEMNALMKLARSVESGDNATLFITHAPCIDCAKGIYQAGIKEVYFKESYRSTDGIEFLQKCNVYVERLA
jgi:dCMP deaminase